MKVLRHFLKDIESNKLKLNVEILKWSSDEEEGGYPQDLQIK
jgi:hypothetical protein